MLGYDYLELVTSSDINPRDGCWHHVKAHAYIGREHSGLIQTAASSCFPIFNDRMGSCVLFCGYSRVLHIGRWFEARGRGDDAIEEEGAVAITARQLMNAVNEDGRTRAARIRKLEVVTMATRALPSQGPD